jgi:hypothetical protein
MKVLEDGRIQCRVRIPGEYKGERFVYEDKEGDDGSQYIWPDGDASQYWWQDGNFSCDCNRWGFLPEHLKKVHDGKCGHEIILFRIIPIEGDNLPILELDYEDRIPNP